MFDAPIQPRPAGCQIPLTPMQLRTWRWSKAGYVRFFGTRVLCTSAVRILGHLEIDLLRMALDTLVQRHEALRTQFIEIDGIPRQQVTLGRDVRLDIVELTVPDAAHAELAIQKAYEEFVKPEIDVSTEPLFAAKLLKVSPRDHVLIYALDHAIADGTSLGIVEKEIWNQYHQACQGRPSSLAELPLQFGDYAFWLQETYAAWLGRNQEYWRDRLSGAPRILLPRTSPSQPPQPYGALFEYQFDENLTKRLKAIAVRERTLLPLVVLAIYVVVASRWCERDDLLLTVVSNARHRPELHSMIGYLASQLHLRIRLAASDSFLSVLDKVRREFLTALVHEDFDRVPDFISEREMYPEVHFNWLPSCLSHRSFELQRESASDIEVKPYPFKVPWPMYPFVAHFSESVRGINLTVRYFPSEFSSTVVEGFSNAMRLFAEEFVRCDTTRIAQCPSLSL